MKKKLLTCVSLLLLPLALLAQQERSSFGLVPSSLVAQNAGNMGVLNIGASWGYGRGHWETQVLMGYIPKHESTRVKPTLTLKENYIPWHLAAGEHYDFQPLRATIYGNAIIGRGFWARQPKRYPAHYYDWLSTRYRFNIGAGQGVTVTMPETLSRAVRSASFFYEVSTCDLYVRAMVNGSNIKLKHILGLSLGLQAFFR